MNRRSLSLYTALFLSLLAWWPASAQQFANWENPHVHPMDMTPDGTKLLAVNTADNRLEVFDVTSGRPLKLGSVPVASILFLFGRDPIPRRGWSIISPMT